MKYYSLWLRILVCILSTCVLIEATTTTTTTTTSTRAKSNHTKAHKKSHGIHIFKFDFGRHVATPFVVCCWVLLASLAKIIFHHYERLSSTIPESCLLILLGIPIGLILQATDVSGGENIFLSSDLFFYYLLPPIILDAGYFMPSQVFYLNIGTILLYAVFGTIFNAFAVGVSLYFIGHAANFETSLLHSLVFGSLISAVDPVAVLAVFEEVHVHEVLYMLVFGESVLNDAASVVLYRTFESLAGGTVDAEQVMLAIASFFVVSIGGTMIGVIFALLTSFITRFTEHVRVIEPVFVFLMSYMAYLSAEVFHFSGIMSILFCGIVMKPYVECNMSRKSHTTIKYFLKLLSSSCDSIIFMFLGASLVQYNHNFNIKFVLFTLLFITLYRAIGVMLLTGLANKCGRLTKVKKVEQFIMSYGGLRGAVAFCLAILIKEDGTSESKLFKRTIVTTTISVVIFTCFIQGTTIKKMVDILGVRKSVKRDKTMAETVNDRMLGYMVAGIEEIIGVHGHGFWRDLLELFNKKYLRYWLERDPDNPLDDNLLTHQRKIAFKHALEYAHNPSMIFARENDGEVLNNIKQNASVAMQLALRAQEKGMTAECGILDMNALSDRYFDTENFGTSEAFNPRNIVSLIPKAHKQSKRTYSQRKYTLTSLDEEEAFEDKFRRLRRNSVEGSNVRSRRSSKSSASGHNHAHRKSGHRHKKSKGRSKKPNMDTLPEIRELEDPILDSNAKNPLFDVKENRVPASSHSGNHLDVPDTRPNFRLGASSLDSGSDLSDTENEGIVFQVDMAQESDSLLTNQDAYVPALPSYSDTTAHLSKYGNQAVVDYREPKQLSEKDKEDMMEAQRWRSFSIESAGEGEKVDVNDPLLSSHHSADDVVVEIRSPWSTDSPSSPPRSYLSEFGSSNGPRRSVDERSRESRF